MRRRLLISTVGIATVVALMLGLPMAALLDRLAYDAARSQAQRQAVSVGLALEPALVSGRVPTPALLEELVGEGEQLTLLTSRGLQVTAGRVEGSSITVAAPGPVGTTLVLSTSDDEVRRDLRGSWLALAAVALVGIAAAAVLALIQSRRLSRPLLQLRRQAARIGGGDFTATTPRAGIGEIDAIASALDDAARQIAGLVAAERAFSANASHQLRSSLTGLMLRLDLLTAHDDPHVREEAEAAAGQAERLQRTLEDLLALARTGRAGERRPTDLYALADEHVRDWDRRFRDRGRMLSCMGEHAVAAVSPGGIGEAIDVLLDNALAHGEGEVTVQVRAAPHAAELHVRDEGPGVPDDVDVFARRIDQAGHGLGLSLARTLVEADGGSLELADPGTAHFRIRVPAATPSGTEPV